MAAASLLLDLSILRRIGRRYPDPPGGDRGIDGLIGGLLGRKGERYRIGHRKFF